MIENLTTNASGWSEIGELIEYVNNGTKNYYSNYTIYANNVTYITSHSYNVSLELNNLNDNFEIDLIYPDVNLTYPLNATYTVNISVLNYSYSDDNPGYCWYSTDDGATNSSSVSSQPHRSQITLTVAISQSVT